MQRLLQILQPQVEDGEVADMEKTMATRRKLKKVKKKVGPKAVEAEAEAVMPDATESAELEVRTSSSL